MVRKSKGFRNHSRNKLKKNVREKGLSSITRAVKDYKVGESVHIDIDPGVQKGMPHPRFQGKTGKVIEKRGRAFVVKVPDGESSKKLTCRPEHLKPQEG